MIEIFHGCVQLVLNLQDIFSLIHGAWCDFSMTSKIIFSGNAPEFQWSSSDLVVLQVVDSKIWDT